MDASLDEIVGRLRELEDERAILRTLYTYAHALDYDSEAEWIDCWEENAVLYWPGREPIRGREEIAEAFRAHPHAPGTYWKHFLVEPRIDLTGDRATVDSYFARLTADSDGPQLASFGRYRDVLVRCRDGRWRFDERRAELENRKP
jgi:ketosteroid isomerase-like protein